MKERLVAAGRTTVSHHKRCILSPRQVRHIGERSVRKNHAPHAGVSSVRHHPEDWLSRAAVQKVMLGARKTPVRQAIRGCPRRFGVRGYIPQGWRDKIGRGQGSSSVAQSILLIWMDTVLTQVEYGCGTQRDRGWVLSRKY